MFEVRTEEALEETLLTSFVSPPENLLNILLATCPRLQVVVATVAANISQLIVH